MSDRCSGRPTHDPATSRRAFLKTSAALAAGMAVAPVLPERAVGQANADPELARLQGQRRILSSRRRGAEPHRQVGDSRGPMC
jgi:hypothetical protein